MLSFNTVNGLYKSSRKSNMLSFVLLFFIKCSVAYFFKWNNIKHMLVKCETANKLWDLYHI